MSFLSYVSRINIEIGRSFIHRSFSLVESSIRIYPNGDAELATKQEKPSAALAVVFPPPPPLPLSSFLSRPSSFSLCLRYVSLSLTFVALLEGPALFSFASFCKPSHQPLFVYPWPISFFVRFSPFVGAPTAFDSFWAELAWPLARAQTRARFNPLGYELHPDRWVELELWSALRQPITATSCIFNCSLFYNYTHFFCTRNISVIR